MTKREREAMQELVNRSQYYEELRDNAFQRLQELNATEGTGHRWCSAPQNIRDLMSCGKDYMWIYNQYVEYDAKADAFKWELGSTLAELNFWK